MDKGEVKMFAYFLKVFLLTVNFVKKTLGILLTWICEPLILLMLLGFLLSNDLF